MRRLRVEAPEVPLHVVVAQARAAAALLAADEVRELHRVADEEDRGVVADEVVVALGRVELQREAARVAPGVGGALLAGDGGEAREHLGRRARLEQRGLGVRRHVLGRLEHAERARALGVHVALRDALAVEVRHLVQEVRRRAAGSGRRDRRVRRVAVAGCGGAGVGGRARCSASRDGAVAIEEPSVGWGRSGMLTPSSGSGHGRESRGVRVSSPRTRSGRRHPRPYPADQRMVNARSLTSKK